MNNTKQVIEANYRQIKADRIMIYKEIEPHPDLTDYIDAFWFNEGIAIFVKTEYDTMTEINSQKLKHEQIQYLEFLSKDIVQAKNFYTKCFGWKFTDYGTEYTAFAGGYVDGGFTYGEPINGTILVVLYTEDIEATKNKVISAGGTIVKDTFSFPGGKRFHFTDLDSYELAAWSE